MNHPKMNSPARPTLGDDDRYVIRRELGRGTMGIVYEAFDTVLRRTVAVKIIEPAFGTDADMREEFEQRFFIEARVAARLSHPGIVVCHDVGKDPKSAKLFIVFEHLKGRTLEARVAAGPMAWTDAVSIVLRVAQAINHAHEHGVIHRDLKPANIMLIGSGDQAFSTLGDAAAIKIMDFGVAKVKSTGVRLTAIGQSFGSPLYMSPEQVLGLESDARSDIFSLGSILCTVLLGRACFSAPNIPEILARVVHENAPAVSTLMPDLPMALDHIVARAMAKRVEDRYSSGAAMAEDLEDVLSGRAPRHTSAGTAQAPLTLDETECAALLSKLTDSESGDAHADKETVLAALVDDAPAVEKANVPASVSRARARFRLGARIASVGLICASIAAGAFLFWRRTQPKAVPSASSTPSAFSTATPPPETVVDETAIESQEPRGGFTDDAVHSPTVQPESADIADEPTPTKTTTRSTSTPHTPAATQARPTTDAPARTRIRLDVEHPLESGRLVAWIDGALVFETRLRAPVVKKIVAIKLREGRVDKMLEVEPGLHKVRVEVSWDNTRRVESQVIDVVEGSTGLLEVRLSRMGKDLRLKWNDLSP